MARRRMSKWNRGAGRTRVRLAALLAEKGLLIEPEDLGTQQGYYRNWKHDLARWFGPARWKDDKAPDGSTYAGPVHVCSWDTMKDCVKFGIAFLGKDRSMGWGHVEVSRAEGK